MQCEKCKVFVGLKINFLNFNYKKLFKVSSFNRIAITPFYSMEKGKKMKS